jgi:hypothetical protein
MNVREEIEALVEFDGRGPGTDAERRAAEHLAERLREMGRDVETESVDSYPNWPLSYALLTLLVIVGSVLSVSLPVVGALLALIGTFLAFLDANGQAITTRRLFGRRASQNVISLEGGDDEDGKGGAMFLVAHYDAGRGGLVFQRRLLERRAAIGKTVKRPIGPFEPLFYTMVFVLICTLLRLPGIDNTILTVLQFIGTALLIVAIPFLIDTALARTMPGANDNASGVACALALADRYGGRLEHFKLHVLLTGSGEALSHGMRSYVKEHELDLDKERTVFINLDEVGMGTVRFATREGLILAVKAHEQLLDICEEIVEDTAEEETDEEAEEEADDRTQIEKVQDQADENDEDEPEESRFGARGFTSRSTSDGYAARSAGFPAITITCRGRLDYVANHHQPTDLPDRIDERALERAQAFTAELMQRLDERVGPDLGRAVEKTLLAEDAE